jgi:catechol 2,3-dioxygenase
MNTYQLPDGTNLSHVHLRTPNLKRAVDFYVRVIGLKVIEHAAADVSLSATGRAPAALTFTEDWNAVARPKEATGLYHLAILFPTRSDLANALRRVVAADYPLQGASDHVIGESLHLDDPDGNGVELYIDQPRSKWPMREGQLIPTITKPLNIAGLLATADERPTPPTAAPETRMGHINLHVADLAEAEKFYHDFLGLKVMTRIGREAVFLAAGGYHHHIAANTWAGKARPPENSIGLISYRLEVPDAGTLAAVRERARRFGYDVQMAGDILQVRDPNRNWLELEVAPKAADFVE